MARRKKKIPVQPMKDDIKRKFESFIHTAKKDELSNKYKRLSQNKNYDTENDLKL